MDLIDEIKAKLRFDDLFRELYPHHYHENGNSRCPASANHKNGDDRPSFQVEKDHGFCHMGCRPSGKSKSWDIFSLWEHVKQVDFKTTKRQLAEKAGISTPEKAQKRKLGPVVEVYHYMDASKKLLYGNRRHDPKDFTLARPDGKGGWISKKGCMDGIPRILYRLPQVLRADTVWFVEGEKDVYSLETRGFIATTVPQGADKYGSKWPALVEKYAIHEPLKDKQVIICPDNDVPGRAHAEAVAKTLHGFAASVKVITIPGPEGSDVGDFIAQHCPEEAKRLLLELVEKTPEYMPPPEIAIAETWAAPERPAKKTCETSPNLTDMGNAQRVATLFGNLIRHCKHLGWLVYDGKRWVADDESRIQSFAKDTIRQMYLQAAQNPDEDRRKALAAYAWKCESSSKIAAMIQLLPSEPGISVAHELFDRDKMLLNTANGTIDLSSGHIRPHSPDDLITKLAPIEYDPDAKCERWEQFILEIMNGDAELGSFLQRLLGYSLTGETREQVWSFLWGKGDNGKGVLLATLAHVLGDYARTTPPETFMEVTDKERLHELARLKGARLVSASELPFNKKFNPRILKAFTGEDIVPARAMYKDGFEYLPEAKLFFSANHRPEVRDTSHGFWRRPLLIPFTRVFGPDEKDDTLRERFQVEAPGILNWLIQGCLDWQDIGLNTPQTVLSAVDEYRSETDVLADFLESCCEIGPGQTVTVKELYESYQAYCEDKGIHRGLGKQRFNEDLLGRPGITKRKAGGRTQRLWIWEGIGLISQNRPSAGRRCDTCNLDGEPCPKNGKMREAVTCSYYQTIH